jgi:predicted permease
MKLSEAWQLSRIPYGEVVYRSIAEEKGRMWWGAFGRNHPPGKEVQDELELTRRALRIAKLDKLIVAIFNVVVSVAPFASSFLGATVLGLSSSISLSLAVTFGFTMLYAIQTLSAFVNAEPSVLLSTLPMARDDFSLITIFSFIRSIDYMVIGSILSQVILTAYLTLSPIATLIMLGASALNAVFAVAVALWFSKVFQDNLLRGGRSKINIVSRLVFISMWGLLLVGVGLMFSIPLYIVPNLETMLLSIGNMSNMLLRLIYPFSAGTVIGATIYSNVPFTTILQTAIAMVAYTLLAAMSGKWILGTIKRISKEGGVKITRVTTKDFSIKTHHPFIGYILKDLKIASRNPATAFFFVLPVVETIIITQLISNFETLRTSIVLVATFMGGIFALLLPLALLSAEGRGLEYTKTLPISSRRIILSKAMVSTATYVTVPLALVGLSLVKPVTSFSAMLIPFLITIAIASASIIEVKLFLGTVVKGKINAIINDLEKLIVGVFALLIPECAYAASFLTTLDQSFSLLVAATTVLAELAISFYMLKR